MRIHRLEPAGTRPKWWHVPPSWASDAAAEETIDLCQETHRDGSRWSFDPWQRFVLSLAQGEDQFGDWAAQLVVMIVPRQAGKTDRVLIPMMVHRLIVCEPDESTYSAHLGKTMRGTQQEMLHLIRNTPSLAAQMLKYNDNWGKEYIEMKNGAVLFFMARSTGSGRGFTIGGDLILDEGLLGLSPETLDAVIPTILTKPRSRVIVASSAGLLSSIALRQLRDRGRRVDPGMAYVEYGMPDGIACRSEECAHEPGEPGCIWSDAEKLALVHPGIECGRVSLRSLNTVRGLLGTDGFLREVGNVWPEHIGQARFTLSDWSAHGEADSTSAARCVVAFEVAEDHAYSTITWAALRRDNRIHVERLHSHVGSSWVPKVLDAIKGNAIEIVADGYSPALGLKTELENRSIPVTWLDTKHMAQAASDLQKEARRPHKLPPGIEGQVSRLVHTGEDGWNDAFEDLVMKSVGHGLWIVDRARSGPAGGKLIAASMCLSRLMLSDDLTGYDPVANIW